jgi:hypothetical protein
MKNYVLLFLAALAFVQVNAQKLPKVQTASLHAPVNIKIDGKAAEWNGLQAYDPNNMLYYSMANDENNLYLVVKSDKNTISRKILLGGFKFSIQAGGAQYKTITFPIVNRANIQTIHNRFPAGNQQIDYTEAYKKSYKEILKLFKTVDLKGFKNIANTETPIYNDLDIFVSASFDESGAYICEFALPLKYLADGSTNVDRIQYTLSIPSIVKSIHDDGQPHPIKTRDGGPPLDPQGVDLRIMDGDTFLKAEYTLAK